MIPAKVWYVLLSWGMAVLVLTALMSMALLNLQRERDRAMCDLITILYGGPEPVAGPAGDRARAVRAALDDYRKRIDCDR